MADHRIRLESISKNRYLTADLTRVPTGRLAHRLERNADTESNPTTFKNRLPGLCDNGLSCWDTSLKWSWTVDFDDQTINFAVSSNIKFGSLQINENQKENPI